MKSKILYLILLITLTSCYKKAVHVDPIFEGGWHSLDFFHHIEIQETKGAYWNEGGEKIVDYVKTNGHKLKISNKKFVINQFPRLDSVHGNLNQYGVYSMILDGVIYTTIK